MNDPTKPGPDADRIAGLKREIAELEAANAAASGWWAAVGARLEQITECKAELSRLRNKQPKGDERPKLRLEEDAQGKRAMLGGYQMPNELIPSLEAETLSPAPSPGPQDVREAYPITLKLIEAMRQVVPFGSSAQDDLLHHLEPIVAAALAQSDAQPVGTEAANKLAKGLVETLRQWKNDGSGAFYLGHTEAIAYVIERLRPLYTAPPAPRSEA